MREAREWEMELWYPSHLGDTMGVGTIGVCGLAPEFRTRAMPVKPMCVGGEKDGFSKLGDFKSISSSLMWQVVDSTLAWVAAMTYPGSSPLSCTNLPVPQVASTTDIASPWQWGYHSIDIQLHEDRGDFANRCADTARWWNDLGSLTYCVQLQSNIYAFLL